MLLLSPIGFIISLIELETAYFRCKEKSKVEHKIGKEKEKLKK